MVYDVYFWRKSQNLGGSNLYNGILLHIIDSHISDEDCFCKGKLASCTKVGDVLDVVGEIELFSTAFICF